MPARIIKNYTDQDYILDDLSGIVIPANGAVDIGGGEQQLIDLSASNDLLDALIQGTSSFQVNDGIRDLDMYEGIDLIRKVNVSPDLDNLGRWVVRSESRPKNAETVFTGAGDDIENNIIGGGQTLSWDFSDSENDDPNPPTGFKRKRVRWNYLDGVYMKEGAAYFYNAPKGTYMDFYLIAPQGAYYEKIYYDRATNKSTRVLAQALDGEAYVTHWVIHYMIEGDCPMGDELNTEAASDIIAPQEYIWEIVVTVPEVTNYEDFHGHVILECYRPRSIVFD